MLNIFTTEDVKLNNLHLKFILDNLRSFTLDIDSDFKKKFFSANSKKINEIVVDVLKESIEFFSNPKLNNNDFRRENEKKLDEFNPIYITALKIDLVNLAKKAWILNKTCTLKTCNLKGFLKP